MRSRQAKGLQQRWLVVANNGLADRIMGGRIQGEGVKVKGLPGAGNAAICNNFIKPPPGSARCAVRKLVQLQRTAYGIFQATVATALA